MYAHATCQLRLKRKMDNVCLLISKMDCNQEHEERICQQPQEIPYHDLGATHIPHILNS